MAAFAEVDPSFPDRILRMAEANQAHIHEMQSRDLQRVIDADKGARMDRRLGQIFALVIGLSMVGAGLLVTMDGHDWVGGGIFTGGAVSLVGVFIMGRVLRPKPGQASAESKQPGDGP